MGVSASRKTEHRQASKATSERHFDVMVPLSQRPQVFSFQRFSHPSLLRRGWRHWSILSDRQISAAFFLASDIISSSTPLVLCALRRGSVCSRPDDAMQELPKRAHRRGCKTSQDLHRL
eukprot:scaffold7052_cov254-Pinguiococcus_pyrenoidosus.AAC.7